MKFDFQNVPADAYTVIVTTTRNTDSFHLQEWPVGSQNQLKIPRFPSTYRIAGKLQGLGGSPRPNVLTIVGARAGGTDAQGSFMISGLESGTHVLQVKGESTIDKTVELRSETSKTDIGTIVYPDPVKEALFCEEVVIPPARSDATGLQGCRDQFPSTVGQVEFYTRLIGAQKDTTISHRWYHRGKQVHEKQLEVTSEDFRTKSSKTIFGQRGGWQVQVISANENVLADRKFNVM